MYLTFSNLNSIHWIIKKKPDIGLYVLFRTFQVNFQDISVKDGKVKKKCFSLCVNLHAGIYVKGLLD